MTAVPFKTIDQLPVRGKRVLIRVDFNTPLTDAGRVADDSRVRMSLPTIRYALSEGCRIILMSHLGRPKGAFNKSLSLKPVSEALSTLLNTRVAMAPDCIGPKVEEMARKLKAGEILLLENLRFHPEETANDADFARSLASLGEVYIDDAFGAVHRAHASVASVPSFFKVKGAGLLLKKRRPVWSRWTRIIRKYEASGKLLDVGCGPGFFLAYAEKHYDVHGIDISEYAVREAKQRTYHVKPSVGDTQNFCPLICVYFNIISF